MPDGAVAYPLYTKYDKQYKLFKRNKLLIKSAYLYQRAPIAIAVFPSTGMLSAYNKVSYLAVHHAENGCTHVLQ